MPPPRLLVLPRGSCAPSRFTVVVVGLVALVAVFHLLTLRSGVGWYGDTYQYLLHAENLVAGRPYADTGYIFNPEQYMAPAAYPAGFPVLLAPVIALFGMSVPAILVLMTLVWAATVAAFAFLFRYELPARYVYGLVLAIGLQPYVWELKHEPLSDLPFLLGVVLSLLCYERAVRAEGGREVGFAVAAGIAAAYAIAVRPLALVLVPAFLVADLVRARRLTRAAIVSVVGCGVLYGFYAGLVDLETGTRVVPTGGEGGAATGGGYGALVRIAVLEHLGDIPRHVAANIIDYARATFVFWHIPQPGGGLVKNVLMGLSLVPLGLGLGHRLRRRFGGIEAFVVLYALSLLPWSFSGVRYLAPLIPFYYFYLFVGLERWHAGRRTQRVARLATASVAVALVTVYALRYEALLLDGRHSPDLAELAADPVYVYLREETPPATVLMTSGDPRAAVFFSRRAASTAPTDVSRWPAFAERLGASYAVVGKGGREDIGPLLMSSHFRLIRSSDTLDLYRVTRLQVDG